MQIVAVNENPCHPSHVTREMTNHQHQNERRKPNQIDGHCVNKLSFQFRIVVMPQRLQMRLPLPTTAFLTSLLLIQLLAATPPLCQAVGYSYTRFTGPVTGPEQKIIVHDGLADGGIGGSGVTRVDFIAKPAYEFAYGVEDAQARLLQNRQETRDGDAVRGSYSVVDPDGNLRVVKYTADHINGFQAEVTSNGLNTAIHGQHKVPHTSLHTNPTPTPLWYFPHTVQQQVHHPITQPNGNFNNDNHSGKEFNGSDNKGGGNYEVNDDYDEKDNGKQRHEKNKEVEAESDENYDNEDEHEDYDANEHSSEGSKEATSYEEHSEEYD